VFHQENTADRFVIPFGNPATFAARVKMIHEIGYAARHQCLEALLPAVFLRIESAVPLDYPTHVSWPVRTQNKRWGAG
jgi:hypothetical protein